MRNTPFQKLKEVAYLHLKLGMIGFGGPAAHIALMHSGIVKKRKWLEFRPSALRRRGLSALKLSLYSYRNASTEAILRI
jgi:hypothetical protein